MKKFIFITSIFFLFSCSSTSNVNNKEIIGQDLIDNGATFFGETFLGRTMEPFCQYITDFGKRVYLKKEFNQKCAKK